MTAGLLRIVLAQLNLVVGDISGNTRRVMDSARIARDELKADLVLFPELALTSYPPEDLLLRPGLHQQVAAAMALIQREVKGITLVVGYPEKDGADIYNGCTALRDGRVLARYRKQHLPNYSVFDEKRYFSPGRNAAVFDFKGLPCALSICEDIWRPGTVAQARAAGARLMLNINASPYHIGKAHTREAILRDAAREGGMPVVYLNLIGGQDELVFDGASTVVDAVGTVVSRAPDFRECLHVVELSANGGKIDLRGERHPHLEPEESIYQALILGVRDYARKNGFKGAVLGLSGGIDSALTLAIAVDALGADQVEAVMMPSRYTAAMSNEDARAEAEALKIKYHLLSIEQAFTAFTETLAPVFAAMPADATEENIQARCRGVLLMALSNKTGRLVLTTGNKSEMAVGYATLYGDMAGGFAPLKDVPKTLVYKLAAYRNGLGAVIPRRVFERPPTAELRANQKDEDSLPPYAVLDPILERYIENDETPEQIIAAGFDAEMVRKVTRMVDRNEYKRRQAAPGVRISRRAFGRDRRYPITSAYSEITRQFPKEGEAPGCKKTL
ncbi:MAG TPA: NAD+ synthase [Gammaproteobacteria bacterium]|nr:NAD+ synthase [Gammaproteobacteria bacterium]